MPGFFDKVREGLDKAVTEASTKSKELLETQQVKSKIGALEGQKKAALEEIGAAVYTMYLSGSFDAGSLNPRCEAVADLDAQIKQKEEELRQIPLRAEQEPAAATPTGPVRCECGAEVAPGTKFCPNCGKKLA